MTYDDQNIFAKILRGEISCNKIYEDDFVLSFHDINPQKKIHALVIPKGKFVDLDDFILKASPEEIVGLLKGINTVAKKLGISTEVGKGYRALTNISEHGGQEVPHLHFHLFGGESVGIGGDPINGSSFRDIIEKFETDDETDAILMIGEIGGPQEVAAGEFAKENMKKPVIGYIAGLTAPKGRVMGHAGAIVSAFGESAIEKVEILKECGVTISKNPSVMGDTVKSVLKKM